MIITSRMRRAIDIAAVAHNGQTDKGGQSYICHLFRVAMMAYKHGEDAFIVGILHDVIEDTNFIKLAAIHDEFGGDVAKGVEGITRKNHEIYRDYIYRCARNYLSRKVKFCDLADNSMPERVAQLPEENQGVVKRYQRARVYLTSYEEIGDRAVW